MLPPPKKVQKKMLEKSFIFLEIEKTEQKKREKRKHNKRKKIKGQLNNRKEFLLKKRWSKNQEEIKEVLFSSRKQFFEWDFFQEDIPTIKDTRGRWKQKKFWKSWRDGFFLDTKWLLENEIWTHIFCCKSHFCGEFFYEIQKNQIFQKKDFKEKSKKRWKTFSNIKWQNFRK